MAGMKALLAGYDDDGLQDLMTNLAGHDMEAVLEALREVDSDVPHCFIMPTRSRASGCPSPATRTITPAS